MLAKIPRPSRTRCDDRGEVVVGEDHVRRLLRHVRAGDPHRDADVGRLERGGVVHAVAGHRDDLPVRLQRVDDAQLVLGRDAGVDRDVAHAPRPAPRRRVASSSAPVTTRERRPATMPRSAAMRAAVRGWSPVIMSTRTPARVRVGDRRSRLRPRRVDDPDQAEVDELLLDRLVRQRPARRRQRPVGDGERAQRQVGESVDRREDLARGARR